MDTTRDIIYRSFYLNKTSTSDDIVGGGAAGSGIVGCVVDTFDLTDVDVVQWLEKRSQADGSDAGDVFMGVRRVRLTGTLYATTRLTLFDDLWTLRAALNPVLAQREEPLDKGYRPLYFSVPTNRAEDYPTGAIELMVHALPRGIQHVTQRHDLGGEDDEALAIPWQATFICRDPGIYGASPVEMDILGASHGPGTWTNRGTYLGKFNALFVVGSGSGTISATVGDSLFTITVPSSSGNRTIRVKDDKVQTFEEGDVESPQMSRIDFVGDTTWPLIDPGDTPYSFSTTVSGGFVAGSRVWFYEQYA